MKKITILLFILSLFSCKKEPKVIAFDNKIIKDTVLNIIIRPVHPNLLEGKSDSLMVYYQKLDFHEIWYLDENRKDLINEIKSCFEDGLNPNDYEIKIIENKYCISYLIYY